jgi:hypothetical protein
MKNKLIQRVNVRVPVTLRVPLAGRNAVVQAVTVSVNDRGALLQCPRSLERGTKLEMENDRTGAKQTCTVILSPTGAQQDYLVPLEFVSPAPGFWHIYFPPSD